MTITIALFFFLYGLVFGSFFNVVGLRIPKGESIIQPPSHCTTCNRQLTALDLMPVLSWLLLRGKCRGCKTGISIIYPAIELATGLVFALTYMRLGFSYELIVGLLFVSMLVIITVSDIAYMIIPDKILIFFGIFIVLARVFSPLNPWWGSIVGALVGFGILYLIAILSKGGMGGGDIKLFFVIGWVLGVIPTLLTLFIAAFIGMVVGLIQLKIMNADKKTPVPFGPSIAVSAIIVYFWGSQILEWYITLFI